MILVIYLVLGVAFSVLAVVAKPLPLSQPKRRPERDGSSGPPTLAIRIYLVGVILLVRPPICLLKNSDLAFDVYVVLRISKGCLRFPYMFRRFSYMRFCTEYGPTRILHGLSEVFLIPSVKSNRGKFDKCPTQTKQKQDKKENDIEKH